MICTRSRRDFFFGKIRFRQDFYLLLFFLESGSTIITTVLILIDFIYLIPYVEQISNQEIVFIPLFLSYLILLTSLIREKNAKVKEILKVLGIEPILNKSAHAIR
jgi:hypothetical protein